MLFFLYTFFVFYTEYKHNTYQFRLFSINKSTLTLLNGLRLADDLEGPASIDGSNCQIKGAIACFVFCCCKSYNNNLLAQRFYIYLLVIDYIKIWGLQVTKGRSK